MSDKTVQEPKPAITFVGFDSAWTDNPKSPGAICSVVYDGSFHTFQSPQLARFDAALAELQRLNTGAGPLLLAIDQPTIVPNAKSMRPVEKLAASLISRTGGGVQPANTGKASMFGPEAPIWRFLKQLAATEHPENARIATSGLHIMEVFPALSLISLNQSYFGKRMGPKYNPARKKTFRVSDWASVINTVITEAKRLGVHEAAKWLKSLHAVEQPGKADQDRLDAIICLLVAVRWRLRPRHESMMIGDLDSGYMVAPCCPEVAEYLRPRAVKCSTPFIYS